MPHVGSDQHAPSRPDHLHQLPQKDFSLIEDEIKRTVGSRTAVG